MIHVTFKNDSFEQRTFSYILSNKIPFDDTLLISPMKNTSAGLRRWNPTANFVQQLDTVFVSYAVAAVRLVGCMRFVSSLCCAIIFKLHRHCRKSKVVVYICMYCLMRTLVKRTSATYHCNIATIRVRQHIYGTSTAHLRHTYGTSTAHLRHVIRHIYYQKMIRA